MLAARWAGFGVDQTLLVAGEGTGAGPPGRQRSFADGGIVRLWSL